MNPLLLLLLLVFCQNLDNKSTAIIIITTHTHQDGDKLYMAVYLKTHPLTDDACIVYELGPNFLQCYSPALGLCTRVFLDDYEVLYDGKENKAVVTLKKVSEKKLVGGDEKMSRRNKRKSGNQAGEGQSSSAQSEEKKEEAQTEATPQPPPFSVVLRPLSTIVVSFSMAPQRPVDIKGKLVPQVSTKNTYNITI